MGIARLGVEQLEQRRLLAATVYVDDDWVGTPLHADPDGAGPATDFGVASFATIQEGINAVDTNGTVNVNAGTYPEDITLDENGVTLLGSGAGVTTIAGSSGGALVSVVWTGANSFIEGFSINQGTSGNVHGVSWFGSASGSVLRNNVISSFDEPLSAGIFIGAGVNDATIAQNTISGNSDGVLFFPGASNNVEISENFLTGNGLGSADRAAIRLRAGFTGFGTSIFNNHFSGNFNSGAINNQSGPVINASANWWGSAAGPSGAYTGSGDAVSSNVDFSPWLETGADFDSVVPGFQGDFTELNVDDASPQTGIVGRIQEAVNLVELFGGLIDIRSGVYVEDVSLPVIKSGLTLLGAGADATEIQGVTGGVAVTLLVGSPNTVIDGIKVSKGLSNNFHGVSVLSTADGSALHANIMTGFSSGGAGVIIDGGVDGLAIEQNTISGNSDGIVFFDSAPISNVSITENFVTGNGLGFAGRAGIRFRPAHSGVNNFIHGNAITGNVSAGGVNNQSPGVVDASGNWWGSASGPSGAYTGSGDAVSARVDFTPWLEIGDDTDPALPGFQGDFLVLGVDDASPQVGAIGRIQEAVNLLVDVGGIVNIRSGTYVEDVRLPAAKSDLTLQGAGSATTTIQGVTGGVAVTLLVASPGATIADLRVIRGGSNNFHGVSVLGSADGTTLRNSVMMGFGSGGAGVIIDGGVDGLIIDRNQISGNSDGIVFFDSAPISNVSITENTITGNGVGFSGRAGVRFRPAYSGANNVIHANAITGNLSAGGVNNQSPVLVDASGNWWGSASGPGGAYSGSGNAVSINVDFTPWLSSAADTSPDPGFQGNFMGLNVDDNSPQSGPAGRLQEAVDLVAVGGTVAARAGTYAENVTIDKRMTLDGTGRGGNPLVDTIIDPASDGPGILITGSGLSNTQRLTVRDLRVTGASGADGDGIRIETPLGLVEFLRFQNVASLSNAGSGIAIDSSDTVQFVNVLNSDLSSNGVAGFQISSSLAVFDTLNLTNSTINANGAAGLSVNPSSATTDITHLNVSSTTFSGNGTSLAAGSGDVRINGFNGDASFSNVTITGGGAHIGLQITGQGSGASVGSAGTISLTNVTIQGTYANPVGSTDSAALAIRDYDDVSSFAFTNVVLDAASPAGLYLRNVRQELYVGDMQFTGAVPTQRDIVLAETGPDEESGNVNAIDAFFALVGMGDPEDRVTDFDDDPSLGDVFFT